MDFIQTAQLSFEKETTVKFAENLELTCSPTKDESNNEWFNITNVKGDFEITQISVNYHDGYIRENKYDATKNGFESYCYRSSLLKHHGSWYSTCNATFYITANTEMKEMCAVTYQLQIPFARLQCLKPCHFFKDEFSLPGYDELKFVYYVRKFKKINNDENIEIHIVNPYDVKLEGNKGDFNIMQYSTNDIDLLLSFAFYPSILEKSGESSVKYYDKMHPINESGPKSSTQLFPNANEAKLLHKISTNQQFSDVYFIASDGAKIPSHRCILAEYSNIFTKLFEETSQIPVNIDVEDFNADTIQSAINFIYQEKDSIKGKETDVFKFAVKYGIHDLVDSCRLFFEETVNPITVCQYIKIAYSNNFSDLKQKCLKLLVEKRKEIDPDEIANLPKNILIDVIVF